MEKQQSNKLIFKSPKIYESKILKLQKFIEKSNPVVLVNILCNLKGPKTIIIIHKPIKLAAEFKLPNKILVDFRNSMGYISLSIAHEYAHILLRNNTSISYPIEQSLAILIQLTYENYSNLRRFNRKTAKELMKLMNAWSVGKKLLKNWSSYWNLKKGRNVNYPNILSWLKKYFSDIFV